MSVVSKAKELAAEGADRFSDLLDAVANRRNVLLLGAALAPAAIGILPDAANAQGAQPANLSSPFTVEECRGIGLIAGRVVREAEAQGRGTSIEFRQSFMNWLGQNVTCTGPRDIVIKTANDGAAFNTIRGLLGAASRPIDLVARGGLRAVGPTAALGSGG